MLDPRVMALPVAARPMLDPPVVARPRGATAAGGRVGDVAPRADVVVHRARLEHALAAGFGPATSAGERARAGRFRRPEDGMRSLLAAGLLRQVVADETGRAPGEVEVDRTCDRCGAQHGRPRAPGSGLELSVSHAGDWVLVASSRAGRVGVDLEPVGPEPMNLEPMNLEPVGPGRVGVDLEPVDLELPAGPEPVGPDRVPPAVVLSGHDTPPPGTSLLGVWVAKEAYLKALGVGLGVDPADVVLRGDQVSTPGRPPGRVVPVGPREGHVAAVCLLGDRVPVVAEREVLSPPV